MSPAMAVDPRAVSVFVVATEEAELHGALLANQIGRFVHLWHKHQVKFSR